MIELSNKCVCNLNFTALIVYFTANLEYNISDFLYAGVFLDSPDAQEGLISVPQRICVIRQN